ncbi:MAG: hypothetical protein ACREXW_01185 [Gammaproteobacteria bacterium]
MTAEIHFHPRILMGRAAEIARRQGKPDPRAVLVRCVDCRHAVPYDRHPMVG